MRIKGSALDGDASSSLSSAVGTSPGRWGRRNRNERRKRDPCFATHPRLAPGAAALASGGGEGGLLQPGVPAAEHCSCAAVTAAGGCGSSSEGGGGGGKHPPIAMDTGVPTGGLARMEPEQLGSPPALQMWSSGCSGPLAPPLRHTWLCRARQVQKSLAALHGGRHPTPPWGNPPARFLLTEYEGKAFPATFQCLGAKGHPNALQHPSVTPLQPVQSPPASPAAPPASSSQHPCSPLAPSLQPWGDLGTPSSTHAPITGTLWGLGLLPAHCWQPIIHQ